MTTPLLTDRQRRARLVARHHLGGTATDVVSTIRDLVAMHSSDPSTPILGMWARIPGFAYADLEDALYETRSLWRLHAMRRTLWIVPAEDASLLEAAAGRKVAASERKRMIGWLSAIMEEEAVEPWLAKARDEVLVALSRAKGKFTAELSDTIPALATKITMGKGKWEQEAPVSSRLLYLMAMDLDLVRGRPQGTWKSSQYRWERTNSWFGDNLEVIERREDETAARAEVARRYLAQYGPVTRDDLKWFMAWTVPQTIEALEANGAVEVQLDRRETGWVLPDDVDPIEELDAGIVSFLPSLDPTPMGWKERRFFLGPHSEPTFDDTGNIGPTVWVDGKIVGGWAVRDDDGDVVVELLEDVGEDAEEGVAEEALRLRTWLQGTVVKSRFPSHLETSLRNADLEDLEAVDPT